MITQARIVIIELINGKPRIGQTMLITREYRSIMRVLTYYTYVFP